ncbi:MAG: hypothetical protein SYC29_17145 [Planctomycetota bacterium]|nr:hypothetical protein [Planctomycetota bacterium]
MIARCTAFCLMISLVPAACAPEGGPTATPGQSGASIDGVLPAAENGLQVRQWRVADDPAVIASALLAHTAGQGLDDRACRRLARNGLRLLRIPADELEALRADLGGTSLNVDSWHGQVCDWRSIVDWPIEATGRALAVDGRVRRFQSGRFRLMIRSWTIPMEDGPYVRLELQGRYERSRPARLDRPAARPEYEGRELPAVALDVLLEAGYAYILTGESPSVEWEPGAEGSTPPAGDENVTAGPQADDEDEGEVPEGEAIGPAALPPLTIGELLFRPDAAPPTRRLLVFVPRIPDRFFPPELRSEAVGDATGAAR